MTAALIMRTIEIAFLRRSASVECDDASMAGNNIEGRMRVKETLQDSHQASALTLTART